MAKNLDTARNILEKALEPLFASFFAGEKIKSLLEYSKETYGDHGDMDTTTPIWMFMELLEELAAEKEKQKEAIKALDIEKLIKLIREA
jgi:hypothetical protein